MLDKIERMFMRLNRVTGRCLAVLLLLMVLNVFYDVVTRYFLHNSSVAMQEMEWHLFGLIILYGMSVALLDEGHVRVDFIYDRFSLRSKALINIVGTVFFLVPLALLVLFGSLDYVKDAYVIQEISEDPGGLPYRWLIKGMIPVSFAYLIFCAVGYVVKQINLIRSVSLVAKREVQR
jgi:TRAP-type mannitol/chloroaromatic compound transport system permease small subunit